MTPGVALNLAGLGVLGAFLLKHVWPLTEAVRLRNALLLQPAAEDDFHWTPETVPHDFLCEHRAASEDFAAIVVSLDLDRLDDWARAVCIAGHLAENAQDKGPLRDNLTASYRGIREGYGYCADFVKVFLALAHAAGLFARQWAFSFDGFGGHGHTVVEIFDRSRGKWLFLDPHNNFHAVDAASAEPLSALEFRDSLLGRRGPVRMEPNGPGRLGYIHEHKALDYFRRGAAEWYLWWGNAVFSYYAHPLVKAAGKVSRALAHVAGILVGVQARIRIYPADESRKARRCLFALRRNIKVGAVVGLVLLVSLAVQLGLGGQT